MIGKSRVKGVHCDEANCGRGVFQVTPGFGRSFGGGTKRLRVLSLLLLLLLLLLFSSLYGAVVFIWRRRLRAPLGAGHPVSAAAAALRDAWRRRLRNATIEPLFFLAARPKPTRWNPVEPILTHSNPL